jgi:hypothetical protein
MPIYRRPSEEPDELHLPTQPDCIVWMRSRGRNGDRYDAEEYVLERRSSANANSQLPPDGLSKNYSVALWEILTLALIIDWNLEDETGKWPFTVESLRRLDPVDGVYLEGEARKRVDGMDGPFGSTLEQPSKDTRSTIPESGEPSSSSSSPTSTDGLPASSAVSDAMTSKPSPSSPSTEPV